MSRERIIGDCFRIDDLERDLLGRGGMGDVYRGVDLQTGQAVAIKALRPEVVASAPNALARFLREGEALRQLNHPNIVQLLDGIEEEGRHYLVMEYVPGGSLRDLLDRQGRLSIERTVEIALDVADALTRAHRLGILHRDLKPSNVLLAEDGTLRLSDFGHAHLATGPRLTQTGTVVGTVLYLSPEACRGETLDARADIWAFGVMLYEMLTGEVPFHGETFPEVFMAILGQPVPDLSHACPDVPDALADLVYRMLDKERAQRIPSVRQVGLELETISEGYEVDLRSVWVPGSRLQIGSRERPQITESRFTTPTPPAESKHNLPVQLTPFVGREAELVELDRLLNDPSVRLVTILGVGGMGKTRLALETGARHSSHYAHGVYLVSLAPLQSVEAIVPTIADALGLSFRARGTPYQQLLDYLREKQTLLLLDNFEHLLDGVDIVADILKTAPKVKILATSRAKLNVRGEQLYPLGGLDFPMLMAQTSDETSEDAADPEGRAEYSAVKLFLQSARRVRPGFELAADDLEHVSRICRLVQGMPLGIVLAAAWIEILTPSEIARELEPELAPGFGPKIVGQTPGLGLDLLETDLRDVPERQRSIRAVCNRSWHMLSAGEQAVFAGLSVFRGGFTRQAAQQVTGASLHELIALVGKSLLHRVPTGRYEVHELLRQYAADKLEASSDAARGTLNQSSAAVHDRHCAYYAAGLQKWEADLRGPRQKAALAEMDADIENAHAAWDWAAAQGQVERMGQVLEGLSRYYEMRGRFHEGEAACRRAVQVTEKLASTASYDRLSTDSDDERRLWAKTLAWQGSFSWALSRIGTADQLLRQSLALLEGPELADQDTRAERAWIMSKLGTIAVATGDWARSKPLYERSLALYQALGDQWGTAEVLDRLSHQARVAEDFGKAQQFAEESLALRRALGDRWEIANALVALGAVAWPQGQLEEAERLLRDAITIRQELGLGSSTAIRPVRGLLYLGWTLLLRGRFDEAHALSREALARCEDSGHLHQMDYALSDLGFAKLHLGQYEGARAQAQKSLALVQKAGISGIPQLVGRSLHLLGAVALVEGAYAEAQQNLQESVAVYQKMGHRERRDQARAVLGYVARGLGDLDQAGGHLSVALRTAADLGVFRPLIYALPAIALLLADQGEPERAVKLYALASRYPLIANSRWFEDIAGKHMAAAAATLPPDVVAAAQERGRARDLEVTVEELLAELEGE